MYDAVICGAGPAGSFAATLLASRGLKVALVDGSHPREKPCGGGVTGRALALVRAHNRLEPFTSVPIAAARFLDSARDASATVPLDDGRLVVTAREPFDAALLNAAEQAGAHRIDDRVTAVERIASRWRVTTGRGTPLDATLLVGADGANSFVRRRVSTPLRRDQLSIATGYFARGVTSREIVIEMMDDPAGYIWSFPRPDHLAIGICAQAVGGVTVEALRRTVRQWIERTGLARGAELEAYSWPFPSLDALSARSAPLAGDGWLTLGDAAGLVDPITREGIFFALQSALFAADAIANNPSAAGATYESRVRAEISAELGRAARYKAGFFRPAFTRHLLHALASSRSVRAIMADLVAGTQTYRGLKWRLLGTLEIGLALRVMTAAQQGKLRGPN
jgi:geranylgeranyl reductase family protein